MNITNWNVVTEDAYLNMARQTMQLKCFVKKRGINMDLNFNDMIYDMCDVPWWERLKTKEEKDAYCMKRFGINYDEYQEIVASDKPFQEKHNEILKRHST